jgi:hypothetical protein
MLEYLNLLLGKSFEDIPGESYNQYREDVAGEVGESYLFYELSLMEEKPWEFLRDRVYPLFARYLKTKLVDPTNAHGVVVAVFHTDRCYLLRGKDFLEVFRKMEGIDATAFSAKIQEWLFSL